MDRTPVNPHESRRVPQEGAPNALPTVDFATFFGSMEAVAPTANGAGPRSVSRLRGSITLKRKGVWRLRWSHGRDPVTGKRIRRKKTVHGTKKDAERALTAELKRIDTGAPPRQARLTLGSWLRQWDADWCEGLAARTRHGYRASIRAHVPKRLLRRSLDALSPSDLQQLFNDMTAEGLSPRTVQLTRAIIRAALNRAMKLDLVGRNVATLVDLPPVVRKEIRVLSPDEVRRFLAEAESDRWYALWALLVTTGLRPGEALGLKWDDWDGNELRVRRALVRINGQGWSLEETKNRRARVVALPEMTVRALGAHRTAQKRQRLSLGETYVDRGLLFTTASGNPPATNNLKRESFHPLLKAAALPRIRLYDLRHTAATLRLVNGEHPKVVQEMLGHASITLTMDTYSHVLPGMQKESAARLEALLAAP